MTLVILQSFYMLFEMAFSGAFFKFTVNLGLFIYKLFSLEPVFMGLYVLNETKEPVLLYS